jgi:hypothetical protein
MDSFAAVLPMPGYSSMNEAKCELTSCVNNAITVEHVCV